MNECWKYIDFEWLSKTHLNIRRIAFYYRILMTNQFETDCSVIMFRDKNSIKNSSCSSKYRMERYNNHFLNFFNRGRFKTDKIRFMLKICKERSFNTSKFNWLTLFGYCNILFIIVITKQSFLKRWMNEEFFITEYDSVLENCVQNKKKNIIFRMVSNLECCNVSYRSFVFRRKYILKSSSKVKFPLLECCFIKFKEIFILFSTIVQYLFKSWWHLAAIASENMKNLFQIICWFNKLTKQNQFMRQNIEIKTKEWMKRNGTR